MIKDTDVRECWRLVNLVNITEQFVSQLYDQFIELNNFHPEFAASFVEEKIRYWEKCFIKKIPEDVKEKILKKEDK